MAKKNKRLWRIQLESGVCDSPGLNWPLLSVWEQTGWVLIFLGFIRPGQLSFPGLVLMTHILPEGSSRHVIPWGANVSPIPSPEKGKAKGNTAGIVGEMKHHSQLSTYSTQEHFTTSTSLLLLFSLKKTRQFKPERLCDYKWCMPVEKVLCNSPITRWAHRTY